MDYDVPKDMKPMMSVMEKIADKETIAAWKAKADALTPAELLIHQQKNTAVTFKLVGMMEGGLSPTSPQAQKVFQEAYELATSVNHASKEECLKTLMILKENPEAMNVYNIIAPGFADFIFEGYKKLYSM